MEGTSWTLLCSCDRETEQFKKKIEKCGVVKILAAEDKEWYIRQAQNPKSWLEAYCSENL